MVHILNIHTATEKAVINLMKDEEILGTSANGETKKHASFLHVAIKDLLEQFDVDIKNLDAIGVTSGPGSYTGIRVGLATAKGLCYALKIPLITYTSLEIIALSAHLFTKDDSALYCPMIDARRMEVYTAIYDYHLKEIMQPSAVVLDKTSFIETLRDYKIVFSGSGSGKFEQIIKNENAAFLHQDISPASLSKIAWEKYVNKDFENPLVAKPVYIK